LLLGVFFAGGGLGLELVAPVPEVEVFGLRVSDFVPELVLPGLPGLGLGLGGHLVPLQVEIFHSNLNLQLRKQAKREGELPW
jgi:hypothetical protein